MLERRDRELQAANGRVENLEIALTSSRRVGMALGTLKARRIIREAHASHCLAQTKQVTTRKLAEITEHAMHTGHLQF